MDFTPSPAVENLLGRIRAFMEREIYPVEQAVAAEGDEVRAGVPYPPALVRLRARARAEGLWNLFLPDQHYGAGLTNWEYGILCEEMARSFVAPLLFYLASPAPG